MDWSGIAGGLLGFAGEMFGSSMANSASMEMLERSIQAQRESMQNRHQWEVEDLKKAGLNPILSATNSAGGVMSGGSQAGAKPNFGNAIAQVMNAFTNSAVGRNSMENNTKNADANVMNAEANKLKAQADVNLANSTISYNEANTEYVKEMTTNVKEFRPLQIEMQKLGISEIQQRMMCALIDLQSLVDLRLKQGESALMVGEAALTSSAASYLNAETNRQHLDIDKLLAEVAQNNQISESALRAVLGGRADAETKVAIEKVKDIANHNNMVTYLNPRATGTEIKEFGQVVSQLSKYINQLNPLNGIFQIRTGE